MEEYGTKYKFPTEGLVYDYKLDDGGFSVTGNFWFDCINTKGSKLLPMRVGPTFQKWDV